MAELLNSAKSLLEEAHEYYSKLRALEVLTELKSESAAIDKDYQRYDQALRQLMQYLEQGNIDAFFSHPTQKLQNTLEQSIDAWNAQTNGLYQHAFEKNNDDFRYALWKTGFLTVALLTVITLMWHGIRCTLLCPYSSDCPCESLREAPYIGT